MGQTLSQIDAIRLTILESIACGVSTTTCVEAELKDTLSLARVLPEHQIDRALVDAALTKLAQTGLAVHCRTSDVVVEHGKRRSVVDEAWTITPAGAAELEQLRRRAGGS